MVTTSSLTVARQKLQAADVPMMLRVSYYLRLSCATLNSKSLRYSALMNTLYARNSAWVETCSVTIDGHLQSSDRAINELLSPITELHLNDQFPALALPIAA